jgi:hypothetical protein
MKEIARLFPARLYKTSNKSVKWLDDTYELSAETVTMHQTPENMGAGKANIRDDDSSDHDGDCLNSKQRDALYPESEQHHPVWAEDERDAVSKGFEVEESQYDGDDGQDSNYRGSEVREFEDQEYRDEEHEDQESEDRRPVTRNQRPGRLTMPTPKIVALNTKKMYFYPRG